MSGRLIAIGDTHGCLAAFRGLLDAVVPQTADRIVTLGDYVDRGPDSRGVLDELIALSDRIGVLYNGEIVEIFDGEFPIETIGERMIKGRCEGK